MRSRAVSMTAIAALVVVVACSGDGPSGLTPARFDGLWELSVQGGEACDGASGPHTRFFEIVNAEAGYGQGLFNVVEGWDFQRPYRFAGWLVTGNFHLENRTVELNFWQSVLQTGGEFRGTINRDGTIAGTLRDPKLGYSPHLALTSCSYTATGRRTGQL